MWRGSTPRASRSWTLWISSAKNRSGPSVSPSSIKVTKLGVLAGGGQLPVRVIAACRRRGRPYFVIAFRGFTEPTTVDGTPHAWVALEKVGSVLRRLHDEGVDEVVLAGPVSRPKDWLALRPDWRAVRLLLKMFRNWRGDDHVLSLVVRELEADGFRVVGAEAAAPDLLMPAGPIGRVPAQGHERDIAAGIAAARELGARDRGQAVIVSDGRVLGLETAGGTAALLGGSVRDPATRGGVLVKIAKPHQERRVDLPSVGVDTVQQAAAAGLAGIALEAGGSLVIGREEVAAAADKAGLFVVGVGVS
ncbi:MAG: UDP-2,3-diacylglucosamine diphosphatase LpxI [Alphaproteobacteria bacterium]|nr:UDP-2,3-diacylglucosamine diphosphatase LpxI [Alphaproteobacteria bacterium]